MCEGMRGMWPLDGWWQKSKTIEERRTEGEKKKKTQQNTKTQKHKNTKTKAICFAGPTPHIHNSPLWRSGVWVD